MFHKNKSLHVYSSSSSFTTFCLKTTKELFTTNLKLISSLMDNKNGKSQLTASKQVKFHKEENNHF